MGGAAWFLGASLFLSLGPPRPSSVILGKPEVVISSEVRVLRFTLLARATPKPSQIEARFTHGPTSSFSARSVTSDGGLMPVVVHGRSREALARTTFGDVWQAQSMLTGVDAALHLNASRIIVLFADGLPFSGTSLRSAEEVATELRDAGYVLYVLIRRDRVKAEDLRDLDGFLEMVPHQRLLVDGEAQLADQARQVAWQERFTVEIPLGDAARDLFDGGSHPLAITGPDLDTIIDVVGPRSSPARAAAAVEVEPIIEAETDPGPACDHSFEVWTMLYVTYVLGSLIVALVVWGTRRSRRI